MSDEAKSLCFYAGEFEKQLDEKRRITIPAKWRFKGDEGENSYLAIPTTYGAISVFPPNMMAEIYQKISKISIANPAKRKVLQRFMSKSCTFGCDKQGRAMLGESVLKAAGINKEVCMVGMGAGFEIWNPQTREKWLGDSDASEDASLLEELGL